MAVGPGSHHQLVALRQLVAVGAVHDSFQQPQQNGGHQRQNQVADHLNGGRGEIHIVDTDNVAVSCKELRKADNEHHGGILYIDDIVVADLGNDVADSLGHNDVHHGLHMGHADGLGTLGLAGVNRDNAAPDGLGHIRAGVDGHDENGCGPDIVEPQGIIREIRQTVDNEHRLQHHGRAPEHLYIDADHDSHQLQQKALGQWVILRIGDGIQHTAQKADKTADGRGRQRQDQGILDAVQVHGAVFSPQQGHILSQLHQFIHGKLSKSYRLLREHRFFRALREAAPLGSLAARTPPGAVLNRWGPIGPPSEFA